LTMSKYKFKKEVEAEVAHGRPSGSPVEQCIWEKYPEYFDEDIE